MTYTILDNYKELIITLTSQLKNTSDIYLNIYKSTNATSTPDLTVTPTYDDGIFTFRIRHSDFQIGDILDRFQVISERTHMEQLNEGISIFVNGVETDVVSVSSNPQWLHTFTEEGVYNVQAVFKGNTALKPYFDEIKTVNVEQKYIDDGGTGDWELICLTNTSSFDWGSGAEIMFQLLRGGNPAPKNKVVEISEPSGTVNSHNTDANGKVSFNLTTDDNAGTYNVVARFFDYTVEERKVLTSCTKKITIKKLTPTITFKPSTQTSDGHARFYVRGLKGTPLSKYKCSVWVNGKKKTTKLSDNGNIGFSLKKKGTYKFKVTVNATTNYKSVSLEKTETKK